MTHFDMVSFSADQVLSLTPSTRDSNTIPAGKASFIDPTMDCRSRYLGKVAKGEGV